MTLKKNIFENIVGKEENAGNQHFLLLKQCFLPYQRQKSSLRKLQFVIYKSFNPFLHIHSFNTLKKNPQENIVKKRKIAQNKQLYLFPQCFLCNLYL